MGFEQEASALEVSFSTAVPKAKKELIEKREFTFQIICFVT